MIHHYENENRDTIMCVFHTYLDKKGLILVFDKYQKNDYN